MADNKSTEVLQAQRNPDQVGDKRCTRNDGKVWRCKKPRVEGNRFCESHVKSVNGGGGTKPAAMKRRPSTSNIAPSEKKPRRNTGGGAPGDFDDTDLPRRLRKHAPRFQSANHSSKDSSVAHRRRTITGETSAGEKLTHLNGKEEGSSKSKRVGSGKVLQAYKNDSVSNDSKVDGPQKEVNPLSDGARQVAIEVCDEEDSDEISEKQVSCGLRLNERLWKATEKEEIWNGRSKMCHQCQRHDNDRAISCNNCDSKLYCTNCIKTWYPQFAEADVFRKCPFCQGNCNCKACLRTSGPKREVVIRSDAQKTKCFKYILAEILPVLKQIAEEQNEELRVERVIQGAENIKVETANVNVDERVYCDNCSTFIVDYFRSCNGGAPPCDCTYDLCLACCRELRAGQQPGGDQAESEQQHCIITLAKEDMELEDEEDNLELKLHIPDALEEDDDETQDKDSIDLAMDFSEIVEFPVSFLKSQKDEITSTPGGGHAPGLMETEPEEPELEEESSVDPEVEKLNCNSSELKTWECGEELWTLSNSSKEEAAKDLVNAAGESSYETVVLPPWTYHENWDIPCPPKIRGGCGCHTLRLKSLFKHNFVSQLIEDVEELLKDYKQSDEKDHSCSECAGSGASVRLAAHRLDRRENHLYCPTLEDTQKGGLSHFQKHWRLGQPVIVRNVTAGASGLSWEPRTVWRALRETVRGKPKDDNRSVRAVDCSDWSEIELNIQEFLVGYDKGLFNKQGWPTMYKLKDWLPFAHFEERLSRHGGDFLTYLPFQDYTDPETGIFNLGSKLPKEYVKPDLGPKTYIAYGLREELSLGDSVTKLHCDMSDTVNVLTHSKEIEITINHRKEILVKREEYKKEAESQLRKFLARAGSEAEAGDGSAFQILVDDHIDVTVETNGCERDAYVLNSNKDATRAGGASSINSAIYGGALWDIFRREDASKLQDYLIKHAVEFRHHGDVPVDSFAHPIHDRSFFLDEEHKIKLKEEYGVEAWTFEQHEQEAVFVPAGCPHQVRNLKSCINVAMDFVSPENVLECLRLTSEFRLLPMDHRAREDRLEVRKMILYAAREAVAFLRGKPLQSEQEKVTKRSAIRRKKNLRHF